MKAPPFSGPLAKISVVAGVVLAFVVYVYVTSRLPAPRERDRAMHRTGIYSIIKPPDWQVRWSYASGSSYKDTVEITPPRSIGLEQRLFVGRLRQAPTEEELRNAKLAPFEFQGRDAMVFEGRVKKMYNWRAVFRRGDEWYDLSLWLTRPDDIRRSDWWPYLESFRAQESAPSTLSESPQ